MSQCVQPCGLQHARLPCPSLSSRVYLSPRPMSWWCYLTILSSATRFFFCPQSFPASGSSLALRINIGASASASVLPVSIQGWFPLGLTGLISLLSKRLSRVFSSTTVWNHPFFSIQLSLWFNSHILTWLLEKIAFWLANYGISDIKSMFSSTQLVI